MKSNVALFIVALVSWGFTWVVISETQVNIDVDPVISVAWRFIISSFIIFAYLIYKKKQIHFSLKEHGFLIILGLFLYSLNYIFFYKSNVYLISAMPAVVFCLMSVMNLIGEKFYFKKQVLSKTWLGAFLGILGIFIIFNKEILDFSFTINTHLGLFFALCATASASMGNLLSEQNNRTFKIGIFESMSWSMFYGGLIALIIGLLDGASPFIPFTDIKYMLGMTYLIVFGSIVAFSFYLTLLKNIGPGRSGYIAVCMPVFALIVSVIFEGLRPDGYLLIGLPITIMGLVLILKQKSVNQ